MARLKKLGAALGVVAALGAVLASNALAKAITQDVKWYTGAGLAKELGGAETLGAEAVAAGTFSTKVGVNEIELEWTGVECVECTIQNAGGAAIGSGKLKFTGVKVVKPAGCAVAATLTTKALSLQADWMEENPTTHLPEEPNYWKFAPTAGEETAFVTFELTGMGCALAGTFIPKGTLFVRSANATNTAAVAQETVSSAAINAGAGGTLHVGTEPAVLTGRIKFKLSGALAGEVFGTH
jgi:hypothetical protein